MYDHFGACAVDPRNLAQRVMEVPLVSYLAIHTFLLDGSMSIGYKECQLHDTAALR